MVRKVGRNTRRGFEVGKGDVDVDAGIVPAVFVLRRVLGTLAVRFRSSFAVSLYTVRLRATERLPRAPL